MHRMYEICLGKWQIWLALAHNKLSFAIQVVGGDANHDTTDWRPRQPESLPEERQFVMHPLALVLWAGYKLLCGLVIN